MKSRHLIFYCIVATVFIYLFNKDKRCISTSSSSSSLVFLPGRRPMRELSLSSLSNQNSHRYYKMEVGADDEEAERLEIQESLQGLKSGDKLDESVYHIDYHGVSTHPTPTPKHPKP